MALFLQHKTDDIQWAVWKMEESLDALLALLPDARRVFCEQELNRFVSERRKMEWLSVRVLLYAMLQEDKEIGYSPEGKPYLTDHSFFISISRAKCSISEKSRTFFSRFFAWKRSAKSFVSFTSISSGGADASVSSVSSARFP